MGIPSSNNSKKKNKKEKNIIYKFNKEYISYIRIFGSDFVKNNKNNCKMIINNIEYEIREELNICNCENNTLKIKLKGINKVTNMSHMFDGCSSLSSLPDISKWNTNNITDISSIFSGCLSLSSLPDISKWNTNNVNNLGKIFNGCIHLIIQKKI